MLKFGNKEFRNLQEQVFKNMKDISEINEGTKVLDEFGIKVVGEVDTLADLPTVAEYKAAHEDWAYGDAFAVGTEAPYTLYILTRANDTLEQDHWFDIGEFPMPGPQGETGPQGEQGPQGPQGNTGSAGASAGFGEITATAQTLVPGSSATATVVASGPDTAKSFAFTFGIPKGDDGETPEWGNITGTLSNQTDLQAALDAKQDELEAGDNIKTINGESILGSGDLHVSGTYDLTYGADSQTINILEVKAAIAGGDILRVSQTTTDQYGYDTVVIYTLNNIKETINYYDLYFNYTTSTYDNIEIVGTITNQRVRMRYNKLLGTITWETLPSTTVSDDAASQWGDITGTLSNQTDLQNALNAKQDTIDSSHKLSSDLVDDTNHTNKFVTASDLTDIAANTAARHTHSNKAILDDITAAFTTADETKLDGIEAGAEVNIIEGIQKNGTDLTVDANRKVNIVVPTKTSDITNDSGFINKNVNDLTNYTLSSDLMDIAISQYPITGAPDLKAFVIDGDPYNLPAGPEGPQGPQGPQGIQGIQGPQGPAGQDGQDGLTTSISVNGNTYTQVSGTITLPDYPEGIHVITLSGSSGTLSADDFALVTAEPSKCVLYVSGSGSYYFDMEGSSYYRYAAVLNNVGTAVTQSDLTVMKTGGTYSTSTNTITPVRDVTVGGTSVVSSGTAAIPAIPDAVSGTNDGTNWTSLTIGSDTYGIGGGGSGIELIYINADTSVGAGTLPAADLAKIVANPSNCHIIKWGQSAKTPQSYVLTEIEYTDTTQTTVNKYTYELVQAPNLTSMRDRKIVVTASTGAWVFSNTTISDIVTKAQPSEVIFTLQQNSDTTNDIFYVITSKFLLNASNSTSFATSSNNKFCSMLNTGVTLSEDSNDNPGYQKFLPASGFYIESGNNKYYVTGVACYNSSSIRSIYLRCIHSNPLEAFGNATVIKLNCNVNNSGSPLATYSIAYKVSSSF